MKEKELEVPVLVVILEILVLLVAEAEVLEVLEPEPEELGPELEVSAGPEEPGVLGPVGFVGPVTSGEVEEPEEPVVVELSGMGFSYHRELKLQHAPFH